MLSQKITLKTVESSLKLRSIMLIYFKILTLTSLFQLRPFGSILYASLVIPVFRQ